jgi:hypothetical protein
VYCILLAQIALAAPKDDLSSATSSCMIPDVVLKLSIRRQFRVSSMQGVKFRPVLFNMRSIDVPTCQAKI